MGLEYVVEPAVGSAVQTVLDLVKVFKFGLSLVNCQDMNKSNLFLSFVTNSDFMIPIFCYPIIVDLRYYILYILLDQIVYNIKAKL